MFAAIPTNLKRLIFPCCLIVAGFLSGAWLLRESTGWVRFPETTTDEKVAPSKEDGLNQPKPPEKVDPKQRFQALPTAIKRHEQVIRQFEERSRELAREIENLDRRIVSLQEAPRYRLSASEIDSRGREITRLLLSKHGNSRLREDIERRIGSLRAELERLREELHELQLHVLPPATSKQ